MKPQRVLTKTAALRRDANLSKGYAAVFATVFIWSLPSLFMYYLNRFYDPWAQNFYRYSVACIAIAPLVLWHVRRGGPAIDMRAIRLCLLPCLPNVVHQVTQVMALFYMGPGVYAIFTRASVIFTALLALAFFPEERFVVRQWRFQLGTLLGLDRKSTRLNSSHLVISYAVFCLKKKKMKVKILIRYPNYEPCFQSVPLLPWHREIKFNVSFYPFLQITRASIIKLFSNSECTVLT